MAIQIKLKNSVVQDSTPSTSDLPVVGELALNANINSIGGFMRASDNTIVKIFGPGSVTTPTATTTVSGISELATNSETTTGTATNRVVTPAGLNAVTVAERTTSNTNYVAKAGSTMTGALLVTNGSVSANSISPSGDANTGFNFGTDTVNICTGGSNRLTVNSAGETVTTSNLLIDGDGIRLKLGDAQDFQLYHTGSTNKIQSFVGDIELLAPTSKAVLFGINSVEKARIDSSGRFLVGTSAARSPANVAASLQVEGTDAATSSISITRNSANTNSANLIFNKSRGAAVGSDTVVQNNDSLGIISFAGNDGTDSNNAAAQIAGLVDGTPGSNDMPGRLEFKTTADGAAIPTTRLTIDSAGLSTFTGNITTTGTISSGNINITSVAPIITLTDTNANDDFEIKVNGGLFEINDITNSANRFIIDSSGTVDILGNLDVGAGIDVTGAITGTAGLSIEGATVFNDAGADVDFKIEGDTEANLFYVNAGTNRVGIGTSGPNELLEVTGNCRLSSGGATRTLHMGPASAGIEYNVNGTTFIQGRTDAYPLAFRTNSTERMHINSSGNVYIGQTSGSEQLGVSSGTNSQTFSTNSTNSNGNMVQIKCSGTAKLFLGSAGSFITGQSGVTNQGIRAEGALLFAAGGHTERMRITSDGNVGIGTTSPDAPLTIHNSSDPEIRFGYNASQDHRLAWDGSKVFLHADPDNANGSSAVGLAVDGTTRLYITDAGNVGIGTTSPAVNLDVSAGSGTTQIYVRNTATSGEAALGVQGKNSSGTARTMLVKYDNNDSFRFATAQAVPLTFSTSDILRMTVAAGGNVGIGTSTPSYKLEVSAETGISGDVRFLTGARHKFIGGGSGNNLELGTYSSSNTSRDIAMVMDSGGRVGIGTTGPTQKLHVQDSGSPTILIKASDASPTLFIGDANRSGDGQHLAEFRGNWNGTTVARIIVAAGDDTTNKDNGQLVFQTAAGGTTTERMRIVENGAIGINTTNPIHNTGYGSLTLNGSSGAIFSFKDSEIEKTRLALVADNTFSIQYPPGDDGIFRVDKLTADGSGNITGANEHMRITKSGFTKHTNSAGNYFSSTGAFHEFRSTAVNAVNTVFFHAGVGNTQFGITIRTANEQNDTSHNYIDCREGGSATQRFVVYANGNVQNQNNSYGSLSDEKLKENITDANSQWDDIKALKVRNFNFTNDSNKVKCLGLVAQEAETVCPSLVFESPDQEQDVETGEITDKGTKTKSLKYSVLYMKAFKCLQEAIVKIETLEAKVAALEGA